MGLFFCNKSFTYLYIKKHFLTMIISIVVKFFMVIIISKNYLQLNLTYLDDFYENYVNFIIILM